MLAPFFDLPNVDLRQVSPDSYPEAKGLILLFTCNHCPYVIAYEDRIKALHAQFAPLGVPVVAISSNDKAQYPQDSFEQMQVRAAARGFEFAYLYDESQEVARHYGAERTPHAFILWRTDAGWEIVYKGQIDNNSSYKMPVPVTETYVADRVLQLLAGVALPYSETPSVGCTIKWKLPV
ncbi:MAG: thioredoxin family protein [Bacteroidia bacterium]|nr:thioredoxin family protein [Bacteroidia bacterium]